MNEVTQTIENHQSLIQGTSGTIASIALEKAGRKMAGALVTPAVWVLNYTAEDKTPDGLDIGLYTLGFAGAFASVAAIGTGLIKSVVDDDIDQKLREIQREEDPKYRKFIKACYRYGMHAPLINAMTIASKGGTAWQHKNGLWAYITDINDNMVMDFKPKSAVEIYQPTQPLRRNDRGLFQWHSVRGN